MTRPLHILPAIGAILLAGATQTAIAQEQPAPAAPAIASTLPGGASSLTEQHGDWTVSCAMTQEGKQCVFSQALGNAQTGQRALSIELRITALDKVEGVLLTPFSLRLDAGINLAVDHKPLQGPFPFLACIPEGCLVPVAFEGEVLAGLKAGSTLEFSAMPLNSPEPVSLALSLSGFTAASNRTSELMK